MTSRMFAEIARNKSLRSKFEVMRLVRLRSSWRRAFSLSNSECAVLRGCGPTPASSECIRRKYLVTKVKVEASLYEHSVHGNSPHERFEQGSWLRQLRIHLRVTALPERASLATQKRSLTLPILPNG